MNRDERLTREPALPPQIFDIAGLHAVYPHERSGGTWVAANQRGVAFALLNWNLGSAPQPGTPSRGTVIPRLIAFDKLAQAERYLQAAWVAGMQPFRLVGVFAPERRLCEWRWDGSRLHHQLFPWQPNHWFSSGRSDKLAEEQRGQVVAAAWKRASAGTPSWIRGLHRSHLPQAGPFSICVHREDARTVSYTEVSLAAREVRLRYIPGSPCRPEGPPASLSLPLA